MPGLRGENHQARNVMGAVTGLPGVRQRAEGISAATRLASDQAVILAYVVPSVGSSAVVIVPDVRDDFSGLGVRFGLPTGYTACAGRGL